MPLGMPVSRPTGAGGCVTSISPLERNRTGWSWEPITTGAPSGLHSFWESRGIMTSNSVNLKASLTCSTNAL